MYTISMCQNVKFMCMSACKIVSMLNLMLNLFVLCTDIHPQNLKELVDGVILFWKTKVDAAYCIKKIDHLQKVITKVISVTGKASGY